MVRLDDHKQYYEKVQDPPAEVKVECLERLLRYITTAEEIRYIFHSNLPSGRIELVDVDPDNIKFRGYDEGLEIGWDTEPYRDDYLKEILEEDDDIIRSRPLCEIWFHTDPWDKIQKLEAKVKELEEKVGREKVKSLVAQGNILVAMEARMEKENPLEIASSITLHDVMTEAQEMGDIMRTFVICSKCGKQYSTMDNSVVMNEERVCHECLVASRHVERA